MTRVTGTQRNKSYNLKEGTEVQMFFFMMSEDKVLAHTYIIIFEETGVNGDRCVIGESRSFSNDGQVQ